MADGMEHRLQKESLANKECLGQGGAARLCLGLGGFRIEAEAVLQSEILGASLSASWMPRHPEVFNHG